MPTPPPRPAYNRWRDIDGTRSEVTRTGLRGQENFGTYSAQLPVEGRTELDTTGLTKDQQMIRFLLVRGRSCWCGGSRIRTLEGINRRIYRTVRALR